MGVRIPNTYLFRTNIFFFNLNIFPRNDSEKDQAGEQTTQLTLAIRFLRVVKRNSRYFIFYGAIGEKCIVT